MANNYTSGTIATNFNAEQQAFFQRHSYALQAVNYGDAKTLAEALAAYDAETESGYSPDIFDQEEHVFWDMENLDIDAAVDGINATFAAFPNNGLTASIDAAWYCSKPRIGEFGGYNEEFAQETESAA